jgi:hypothetical protein
MAQRIQSDEELVEKARALLGERKKFRWYRLVYGIALVGVCIYLVAEVVQKFEKQDSLQMSLGFFTGIGLAFLSTTIGVVGAALLAISHSGFSRAMRTRELLVSYHDRLRELRALPDDSKTEKTRNAGSGCAGRNPPAPS